MSRGTAPRPERSLQNSAWRAPGFKGKEVKGEGDRTEDETLWLLAKKGLPSLPRACDRPGRHEGQLSVLLHEQQDLVHPASPTAQTRWDRARQVSQPSEPIRCSCRSSAPVGWRPAAQLKAKFSPCSAPFARHNSCWCPG